MLTACDIKRNSYLRTNNILIKETKGNCLTHNQTQYNCGSFALSVWGRWYRPYGDKEDWEIDDIRDMYYDGDCSEESACDLMADVYVGYMTRNPSVREICSESELRADEYLVLFKASIWDFHYVRRLSDGTYWHKMGRQYIVQISKEQAWDDNWWHSVSHNNYSGKLRLLAVKKGGMVYVA